MFCHDSQSWLLQGQDKAAQSEDTSFQCTEYNRLDQMGRVPAKVRSTEPSHVPTVNLSARYKAYYHKNALLQASCTTVESPAKAYIYSNVLLLRHIQLSGIIW